MARLGDVCKKGTSNIAQKDLEVYSGRYPIYGASGLITNVDFFQQEKPYIAVVKDGAGVGRIMKLPAKSSVIGTMQYIIPNDTVDISYLAYAMENMNLSKYFSGATIPHIYFKDYQKEEFPLPSLAEQRRIAAVLDKVSDLIAKRRQQLAILDEMIKARFVEMFGKKNYRYTGLISLIKEGAGLSYGIVQPGDAGTGDMGILRPVDFANGKIDVTRIKYIDRNIGKRFKKTELTGDELLITVRGTTGITALTDDRFVGMNVTRGIAVIRYDKDKINPIYLNAYLKMDASQRYIKKHTRGATLQQINLSDLRVHQVLVPQREQQEQFASFVEKVDRMRSIINRSLEKLKTLKNQLFQLYFN